MKRFEALAPYGMKAIRIPAAEMTYFPSTGLEPLPATVALPTAPVPPDIRG